jgi:hypothetical protein
VAWITRKTLTLGGAHALFKTSPLGRLFRDGASGPIMPPSSDACLASMGIIEVGLDAHDGLRSFTSQQEDTTVPGMMPSSP